MSWRLMQYVPCICPMTAGIGFNRPSWLSDQEKRVNDSDYTERFLWRGRTSRQLAGGNRGSAAKSASWQPCAPCETFHVYWLTGLEEWCERRSGSISSERWSTKEKVWIWKIKQEMRCWMKDDASVKNLVEKLSVNRPIDINWLIAVWKCYLEEKLMNRCGADTLTGSEGAV